MEHWYRRRCGVLNPIDAAWSIIKDIPYWLEECPRCKGDGSIVIEDKRVWFHTKIDCPTCEGSGLVPRPEEEWG